MTNRHLHINRRRVAGFSLLEMTLGLAVAGITLGGLWQVMGTVSATQGVNGVASEAQIVAIAAQSYINEEKSSILALGSLSTLNSVTCIKVTDADSCATALDSLQAKGYLPAGFNNQNAYGQSYKFYVRREDGGTLASVDDSDRLNGLVISTGGIEISDKAGGQISSAIGAAGGFIYDADDGDPAGTSGTNDATTIRGTAGGWSVDLTAAGWTVIGNDAQQGHIAVLTSIIPSTASGAAVAAAATATATATIGATTLDELTDAITNHPNLHVLVGDAAGQAADTSRCCNGTVVGVQAAKSNNDISYYTAFGAQAAYNQNAAGQNVIFGAQSGYSTTASGGYVTFGSRASYSTISDLANSFGAGAGEYDSSPVYGYNNSVGYQAHRYIAEKNNVGIGYKAAYVGFYNELAVGAFTSNNSGNALTTTGGGGNVYIGFESGYQRADGPTANTFIGARTAYSFQDGYATAVGYGALQNATTAAGSTALGYLSMGQGVATGDNNTAAGAYSLYSVTSGADNSAAGYQALYNMQTGSGEVGIGYQAGYASTADNESVAVGYQALRNSNALRNTGVGYQALYTNSAGVDNVAYGYKAAYAVAGSNNTAIGYLALSTNTASNNTAIGREALGYNQSGTGNTAIGTLAQSAVSSSSAVSNNTAFGYKALAANTGQDNTAIGYQSLLLNNSGSYNTAVGVSTLAAITTGTHNTAIGYKALTAANNTGAGRNVAIGAGAGESLTTGTDNVLIGYNAGKDNGTISTDVTAALTTGSQNTLIGYQASVTSSNATNRTAIGYQAVATSDNQVMFGGRAAPTTISGKVDWSTYSDARLKTDIQDTDLGLDFILKLRPVRYRLIEGNQRLDYGFIAQEVADLVGNRPLTMVYHETDGEQIYRLSVTEMLAPTVKGLQEQIKQRDALQQRQAELQTQLQQAQLRAAELEKNAAQLVRDIKLAQQEKQQLERLQQRQEKSR